ncbi:MAG: efflux RND transporter periplasmic adaptor subunit [Phycisphaeraceae bacterium]|nr:efflux RND transporter periplasmic adaptor subunit [Phycisphaeraceae bacterium]
MDLHKLSNQGQERRNDGVSTPAVPPPQRRWLTRIALPVAILLATLALILYAARDVIQPATQVRTTRAVAVAAASNDTSATRPAASAASAVVAQAPGWVEPDPYPVYATGLTNGIVESVHVLEGDTVRTGQLLVQLVADDAALALSQTKAELARAKAALTAAQADLDEPVALERVCAVTKAQVDARQAALTRLGAEVASEQARLDELNSAYDRLAGLDKRSVSELKVEEARYRAQSQRAVLEAMRQRRPELQAQLETAKAEHAAADRNLELKTQLQRTRDEAMATRDAAQTAVEEAELRLQRMTINSPIDGVVMARLVGPGSKIMLDMDSPHSAHAIHLYDPKQLQIRVDVPLADAAKVGLGQRAEIIVDVLPDVVFGGEVTRLVHQADIAKNTVQFKVAVENPSPLLKPDMLARVKFYSGEGAPSISQASSGTAMGSPVAIRKSAVVDKGEQTFVWWVSPVNQRIEKRTVALGQPRADDGVTITSGLNPGDLVVDEPDPDLKDNQRVRSHEHHRK